MSETPTCNIDGCAKQAEYLLSPHGDLCRQHAVQYHDEIVAWMDATMGPQYDND
jgi:hypothetical protein